MRWSSARIVWTAAVLLVVLVVALDVAAYAGDRRFRTFVPYGRLAGALALLAAGLLTGVLPEGRCPPQHRGRALAIAAAVFAVLAAGGIANAHVDHRTAAVRAAATAWLEASLISGAVLMWLTLGGHRNAAIATGVIVIAGLIALWIAAPRWLPGPIGSLPPLLVAVHGLYVIVACAASLASAMVLTARLRFGGPLRLSPALAGLLVSGMFVACGLMAHARLSWLASRH